MEDLYNLNQWDSIPRLPAVQPSYYPFAPAHAQTFQRYQSCLIPLGHTTLDTYSAPAPVIRPGGGNGNVVGIPGNGLVLSGNAPYQGVYTGVQQE